MTLHPLAAIAAQRDAPEAQRVRVDDAVREFESQLLRFLVRGMHAAFLEEQDGVAGLYSQFAEDALTRALADGRDGQGLGLTGDLRARLLAAANVTDAATAQLTPLNQLDPTMLSVSPLSAAAALSSTASSTVPVAPPPIAAPAATRAEPLLPEPTPLPPLVPATPARAPVVNSGFGPRRDPITGASRQHRGVDLRAKVGDPVTAATGGIVESTAEVGGFGRHVVVRHPGGYETIYAHLDSIDVRPGDPVAAGDRVGLAGQTGRATGPHLHFEVRHDGSAIDPRPLIDTEPHWVWPVGDALPAADTEGADHDH